MTRKRFRRIVREAFGKTSFLTREQVGFLLVYSPETIRKDEALPVPLIKRMNPSGTIALFDLDEVYLYAINKGRIQANLNRPQEFSHLVTHTQAN